MEISPPGIIACSLDTAQEHVYLDPDLCIRSYPVSIVPLNLTGDTHHLLLKLTASSEAAPGSIPLQVQVDDRLVLVPNSVRLVYSPRDNQPKVRMIAIDRQGSAAIEIVEHDRRLVDVRRVEDDNPRRVIFEIQATASPEEPVETSVVFEVDGRDRRRLSVRLEPASWEDS